MNVINGTVSNIRHSMEVNGAEANVSTVHIAVFEVDGHPVELKLSGTIFINNGDNILVAGELERGLLRGRAYYNQTKGVKGKDERAISINWAIGIILCTLIFTSPLGIWFIRAARKYEAAYKAIDL